MHKVKQKLYEYNKIIIKNKNKINVEKGLQKTENQYDVKWLIKSLEKTGAKVK